MEICDICGREIGEATWDAQSAERHRQVLEVLKLKSICETCEFEFEMRIKKFKKDMKR